MTCFLRILEAPVDDKPRALAGAIAAIRSEPGRGLPVDRCVTFERDPKAFSAVPGSPFAYWVSDTLLDVFRRLPPFEGALRTAKQGLATADDFRFVRARWEVALGGKAKRWFPFAKGGAYSPIYADVFLVGNWAADGHEMKAWAGTLYNESHWSRILKNVHLFFRPGLTWPLRTTSGFGVREMPAGCIFGHKGPAAFIDGDSPEELLALVALLTSRAFGYFVGLQLAAADAAARSYEVGVIQRTPIPSLEGGDVALLAGLARRARSLKCSLDTTNETSHAFLLPPGLNERVTCLDRDAVERELESIQQQVDETAFKLYGIGSEDRAAIEASSQRSGSSDAFEPEEARDEGEDPNENEAPVGAGAEALNSWLVGAAFGRFDPRLATGERPIPPERAPFDALPPRSPGMWPEREEPALGADILVDDEGHADDLAARAQAVAERVRVEVPENLRGWLAKEFFPLHLRMYSKSRRKAPIYWQLATPSAGYSVWLYVHAFSKDTLFRVQNDYVAAKLAHEERRLEALASELRDGPTAAQRKVLAAQEALVEDLRALLDEVKRVAPLWKPNLDDGVIINFAPLWRLVPQTKAWQKELKSTWDALCDGKYDWAHLAMHLWPERLVPKCAKDRSLAIAHGLEEIFWAESADGKWSARKTPTRSVDELVRERTSPAVKAALKTLLEAPAAAGNGGRGRPGRRRSAVADRGDA